MAPPVTGGENTPTRRRHMPCLSGRREGVMLRMVGVRTLGGTKVMGLGALLVAALSPARATAGIPECNGIRLESVQGCELRGSLDCDAGCQEVKFELACSASLHAECRGGCDVDADIE